MDTRETAEIPDPIIPKATRNQGDSLLPSKKVLSRLCLEVSRAISIKSRKYKRRMTRIIVEFMNWVDGEVVWWLVVFGWLRV
jgi:hypothetical protein